MRGITRALDRYLRGGEPDDRQILLRQRYRLCPKILLQVVKLGCARNRHDPRLLRKKPGQREQPKPIAETSGPILPSFRIFILEAPACFVQNEVDREN